MKEIKRIKLLSLANMAGAIYFVIGGTISFAVYIFSLANSLISGNFLAPLWKFILFNFGIALWIGFYSALLTGIIGWLLGLISGWLYNIFTKKIGGLKIELEEEVKV